MRIVIVAMIVMTSVAGAEPPLKGNVLVWADAKWYVDADDKSPSIRLGELKGRAVGRVVPAKVFGTKGDFVEVELVADGCAWTRVTSELAAVRLFVKRADLANLLFKPFSATYKNGSRLVLAVGLPI